MWRRVHRAVRALRLGDEVFCVLCALGAEQRGREAGGGRIVRLEREDAAACRMRRLHVPLLARVRGIAAAQPARERRCAEEHGVLLDYRSDGYEDERRVERVRRLRTGTEMGCSWSALAGRS